MQTVHKESYVHRASIYLLIAGIIFIITFILHPDESKEGALLQPAWVPVHYAIAFAFLLVVLGLPAIHIRAKDMMNGFGKFALVFTKIMFILLTGAILFIESMIFPAIANSQYADALSETGPVFGGAFGLAAIISFSLLALSLVLLGIFLISKRIVNPIAGILLFGGVLAAFSPPLAHLYSVIGGVALGLGITWIGASLYNN